MGVNGFRVVDADGHGGERREWPAKLPERFAARFEEWRERCRRHYGRLALPGGGLARPGDRFPGKSAVSEVGVREGMHDPAERLKDMDLEGIDVTVNYSGGPGEEWALLDAEFAAALCRTINEAKAEFNAHCPERLKSVAILPMIDPPRAAAELRHAVEKLGHVGLVTRQHVRDKNLDDPSFDVVWAEAERLGVPVCVHGGGQAPDQVPIAVDRYRTRLEVHALTHPIGGMLAVMAFTVGGVLHRFPKLRVGIMEANCWWLPGWLERLDDHWRRMPEQAPQIDRKPSEYFLDGRCFIGCDPGEEMVGTVARMLGAERIVYASDYYHWDCGFPETARTIANRSDLDDAAKRKILAENAERLYGLA
jgi:predicted TIM-barrel fold metal-dependent hydrolase